MPHEFNLAAVFEVVSAAVPDREFLVWRDRRPTYGEVGDRSRRLAAYLASEGLGCHRERCELEPHEVGQDLLGIYAYNGNEWLEAMIGSFAARVAPFNINYRYVRDELLYLLRDASPTALVYQSAFAPTLAEVLSELPFVRVLLQVADDSGNELLDGAVDYEEALTGADPGVTLDEPSPDDLYVLYTGGTTGMPKGALWRQHDIFMTSMGGRSLFTWEPVSSYDELAVRARSSGGARSMMLPPLMHGAAQWGAFTIASNGGTIVFPGVVDRVDPLDVLTTAERERVASITLVGDAMGRPLIQQIERGSYDLSGLAAVSSGGAALTPSVKQRFIAAVPGLMVLDAVGSSETGAQMSHISSGDQVATGRFAASPNTWVIDDLMEAELEPGHDGDGWLAQTGWVPLGYLGDPDKTARTFPVVDGVRCAVPGDRARHLADGSVELLGRDSVTINSGGEKIFAEEVELAIASHPAITDVIVTGRPSERWGQEVVAVVSVDPTAGVTAQALIDHAARSIARYKLPKAIVFRDAIQRSPSGKADYRWARQVAEHHGAGAARP